MLSCGGGAAPAAPLQRRLPGDVELDDAVVFGRSISLESDQPVARYSPTTRDPVTSPINALIVSDLRGRTMIMHKSVASNGTAPAFARTMACQKGPANPARIETKELP